MFSESDGEHGEFGIIPPTCRLTIVTKVRSQCIQIRSTASDEMAMINTCENMTRALRRTVNDR